MFRHTSSMCTCYFVKHLLVALKSRGTGIASMVNKVFFVIGSSQTIKSGKGYLNGNASCPIFLKTGLSFNHAIVLCQSQLYIFLKCEDQSTSLFL